ncbi:MAG: hypothetical protein A2W52_02870 [Candidatus Taylorbacteria bacterium RIFCSPHIGHO2_02_49_25]|uniref:Uncharacterized protein n=1 Tax=Candidatus Taylorbacteria bacterium RIFCSPHIGHO2_02_49_25 TaxID=1802305 RepID=A0A1G2MDU1_9BACT|nr:MAG: Plastocyanin [Parcubacteria group bacterium GW2011_GWF2_50_9]OHA21164.1 MAG: hypothetical protein A2759_01605 [Candidatus Taylorbacteria bacterium RIFCSPHIGHO2_01_FULL_49_60]OHA21201.1 MAG: hypothetical protein A2W52_02870 [Candidatus Taylorbacteria bacterium RIFCSPHIGHO2_02_49_25]OHA35213.1 MAG: hypothetical protein A2W65_00150 [Candidatus Taylorbacteria bacterium RIFCSPLOWO2_02_50_13]OHA36274.1 MAG: hypothetical protein A3B27_00235 [Candidatus Taylorbacteria bacterium RIFCSPLOWO2_01_F
MHSNTKQGFAPIAAIIIALLVIGGGAYGIKKAMDKKASKENRPAESGMPVPGTDTKEKEVFMGPTTLQTKLSEQNASGQGGQAMLVQTGTSTVRIIVNLVGKPPLEPQPAHIHLGSCPNPGAVKYPLTNIDKGASITDIPNLTLSQLISELPLAINVHKSVADLKTYVACGDIVAEEKKEAGTSSAMPVPGTDTPEMIASKEWKVTYTSQGFSPKTITVKKGDMAVFENKTGKSASVASDEHPTHTIYPEFDQYKTEQRGKTEFRFVFEKVGTWKYHDHLNSTMTGTVIVE